MQYKKEIVTAVGTLVVAVGVGFVMQSSESAKERYGSAARPNNTVLSEPAEPVLASSASADILLQVQEVQLTSGKDIVGISGPTQVNAEKEALIPSSDDTQALDELAEDETCKVIADAKAIPGAFVNVTLNAPCASNERLTVHHNGMVFTESTDDAGDLNFTVPALAQEAVFIMAFANGDGAVAQTSVTDVYDYDRVVLQWRGETGFELHAREFGADYGDAGHVWAGALPNMEGLKAGTNGLILRMGDTLVAEPLMAEIYTFPRATAVQAGLVDLSIEAEVTQANCGLEIEAQSMEMDGSGKMTSHDLSLSVPDCDAIGSFLVLNNLVSDLKVASN